MHRISLKGPIFWSQFSGLFCRPLLLHPFGCVGVVSTPHALSCKVNAFWRHLRYLYQKFADRDILMLNVDETSVGYTMKPRLGNVVAPAVAKVSKQDRRGAWTYLSLICNSTDVQGKLPHYLIGSKTRLTRKLLRAQKALPPTRLKIIAQKSAWTSAANLVQLLRDIGEVLKLYPGKQGILLLDCAPRPLAKGGHASGKEAEGAAGLHTGAMH